MNKRVVYLSKNKKMSSGSILELNDRVRTETKEGTYSMLDF